MTLDEKALEAAIKEVLGDVGDPGGGYIRATPLLAAYIRAREAQGYVEVPVLPTQDMLDAGFYPAVQKRGAKSVWGCMLAARPQKEGE